jgi:hypothetical protein
MPRSAGVAVELLSPRDQSPRLLLRQQGRLRAADKHGQLIDVSPVRTSTESQSLNDRCAPANKWIKDEVVWRREG